MKKITLSDWARKQLLNFVSSSTASYGLIKTMLALTEKLAVEQKEDKVEYELTNEQYDWIEGKLKEIPEFPIKQGSLDLLAAFGIE